MTALLLVSLASAVPALAAGATTGPGPSGPGELPPGALARIGDDVITAEAFRAEMERRGGGLPGQYATPEQRRALLDEMIEHRALVAAARAEGFDRRPDVVAAFERILVARYRQQRLDPELDAVVVEPWEVESFYEQHKQEYAVPERFRAAIIKIGVAKDAPEADWAAAETRATLALEETRALDAATNHFGKVAVRFSEDRASRYRGGVIGWITRDLAARSSWPAEVTAAIFALDRPGEIAPVVRAANGVYLVRLVERDEARARPLAVLADGFRNQIVRDRRERLHDGFVGAALGRLDIRVNEGLLESIVPPEGSVIERRPPALPAS